MTTEEAFKLFADHGGCSPSTQQLMSKRPTELDLVLAFSSVVDNGQDPVLVKEATELVREYFQNVAKNEYYKKKETNWKLKKK